MNIFQLFIRIQRQNTMMKKQSKTDIKRGRIHRCANCDAICGEEVNATSYYMECGRQKECQTLYYCDNACMYKQSRDELRPKLVEQIQPIEKAIVVFTTIMKSNIKLGHKSKTCFEAIRMAKQHLKVKNMLLGGETAQHIVAVEMFKLSEIAMGYAELIADEEDKVLIGYLKELDMIDYYSQVAGYNMAVWAREHSQDTNSCLTLWFS